VSPTTVENLVSGYAAAFSANDAQHVASFYDIPSMIVSSDSSTTFHSSDAMVETVSGLLQSYLALGFERAEPVEVVTEQLQTGMAAADVSWRLITSGEPIEFRTRYWIVERNGQLKIQAVLAYSEAGAIDQAS